MKQNKETLKEFFETGDKPTQEQYSDLIDSYVDSQQEAGEANRRFVINENGDVNVTDELQIPEYTLSEIVNNKIALLKDGVAIQEIDLTSYIDDTNLARLISGTVDENGLATFTRDDDSTFTVDFSSLITTKGLTSPIFAIINSEGSSNGDLNSLTNTFDTLESVFTKIQYFNTQKVDIYINTNTVWDAPAANPTGINIIVGKNTTLTLLSLLTIDYESYITVKGTLIIGKNTKLRTGGANKILINNLKNISTPSSFATFPNHNETSFIGFDNNVSTSLNEHSNNYVKINNLTFNNDTLASKITLFEGTEDIGYLFTEIDKISIATPITSSGTSITLFNIKGNCSSDIHIHDIDLSNYLSNSSTNFTLLTNSVSSTDIIKKSTLNIGRCISTILTNTTMYIIGSNTNNIPLEVIFNNTNIDCNSRNFFLAAFFVNKSPIIISGSLELTNLISSLCPNRETLTDNFGLNEKSLHFLDFNLKTKKSEDYTNTISLITSPIFEITNTIKPIIIEDSFFDIDDSQLILLQDSTNTSFSLVENPIIEFKGTNQVLTTTDYLQVFSNTGVFQNEINNNFVVNYGNLLHTCTYKDYTNHKAIKTKPNTYTHQIK